MRRRLTYVALACATIAVGLLVHWCGDGLGPALRDIAGDALWGCMMFWWVSACLPLLRASMRGALAFGVCAAVEVSQLLHTPWLDRVRGTSLGHLVLGSDFDARDLLAYAAGVALAVLCDRLSVRPARQ